MTNLYCSWFGLFEETTNRQKWKEIYLHVFILRRKCESLGLILYYNIFRMRMRKVLLHM